MARKRILAILASCDFEGVWRQCSRLSANLPAEEFDVRFALLAGNQSDAELLEETGLPVYLIGSGRKSEPLIFWPLMRFVKQQQPDLVHCWDSTATLYGPLAAWMTGGQTVFCSTWQPTKLNEFWKQSIYWLSKRRITKMIIPSRALVKSDHMLTQLAEESVEIIPPGISHQDKPSEDRNDLLAKLGVPKNSQLIAATDPMDSTSRLREMIWATELLKVAGHNVQIFICGKGRKRKAVENFRNQIQLEDRVHFLEDRYLIRELMGHLDIFWQLGGTKGKCVIPTVEAMRRSIPVIADNSATHRELLQHEKTGILVPCCDPAPLASWTQHLLEHPEQRREIGVNGQDAIEDQFGQEAALAAMTKLYRQSLGSH